MSTFKSLHIRCIIHNNFIGIKFVCGWISMSQWTLKLSCRQCHKSKYDEHNQSWFFHLKQIRLKTGYGRIVVYRVYLPKICIAG